MRMTPGKYWLPKSVCRIQGACLGMTPVMRAMPPPTADMPLKSSNPSRILAFLFMAKLYSCARPKWRSDGAPMGTSAEPPPVSYTHLRAHETDSYLVCRLLLEKKKKK